MLRYINDGGEMPLCRDSDDGNQELGLQSSEVNTNRSAVIDHLSLIIDVMRNLAQICTVKSRVQYALMYNRLRMATFHWCQRFKLFNQRITNHRLNTHIKFSQFVCVKNTT